MPTKTQATIEDLYRVRGKAELVNGEIVHMSPTGDLPGRAGGSIYASLRAFERRAGGRAYLDNVGFVVDLPRRQSFCPDAAFYVGKSSGMKFLDGAPALAVEVRSENDRGPKAERKLAEKRADYFAAGTSVVWDVDLLAKDVVKVYRASDPERPTAYRRGEAAEAEPAVPGWTMPVDELCD